MTTHRGLFFLSFLVIGCGTGGDGSGADALPDTTSDTGQELAMDPGKDPGMADQVPVPDPSSDSAAGEETTSCADVPPPLKLTLVADGLASPVLITGAPGDTQRLYIVEQKGTIRILEGGQVKAQPFLDLTALTSPSGERGLLGLAFHPQYGQNGRFWVNYTDLSGDTVVAEYRRSDGDPELADPGPVKMLLNVAQPFGNHNGGMVAFGPDGYLYVGMGDGGSGGDPQGHGQDPSSQLGAMLRLDVDNHPTPPPGNYPGADLYVWDIGLRNPWRFSFDRATGDLYIGDVGQGQWEEIHVEPQGQGNRNYGWNVMEGNHCYEPPTQCDTTGLTLPVDEYDHGSGCSVTGGYVYRGQAIDCLDGWYLYGDYCSNRVWAFRWTGASITGKVEITADLDPGGVLSNISSFGEDESGELYVVSLGGTVHRIDADL